MKMFLTFDLTLFGISFLISLTGNNIWLGLLFFLEARIAYNNLLFQNLYFMNLYFKIGVLSEQT